MAGFENGFQPIQDAISAQLVATTRTAGQLAAEDVSFLGSSDPKAKRRLERQNRHLLELAQRLISGAGASLAGPKPEIKKPDQIDENWRAVVDVIDSLLERADRSLDEFSGVIRRLGADKEEAAESGPSSAREGKARRIHPLSKPQLSFKHVPRNDETTAFRPLLTSKPHAIVPLEESLRPVSGELGLEEYKHPYETEIIQSSYPPSTYIKSDSIPPVDDADGKTLTWVDKPEQVDAMLQELKQAKEIAIDLEHHDQHSYVGLVCLMQISTREKDWIVDTLKPWRQDLQVLNEVFADPAILKVFHGSTMDMIWLQRDLGLYVVGLFDTYHAATALQYPKRSLAYLLKRHVNFDAQKKYQMADWRTRPLTTEMMHYARADTHYLLNVYDQMRNALIDASTAGPDGNQIDYVLEQSKQEALQRYERSFYDIEKGSGSSGWLGLLIKTPAHLRKEQFAVFRAVHQFRDKVARQVDESLLAVMRNDTLFAIARTLPEDIPALMACINPVSQFVQPKLSELLNVIKKAKKSGEDGPELAEVLERPENLKLKKKLNSFRKADAQVAAATTITGVAQTLQVLREAAPVADGSKFWGAMLDNGPQPHTQSQQSGLGEMNGLHLSLPFPSTSAAEESTHSTIEKPARAEATAAAPAVPTPEPATFSIKDLRKSDLKRKAAEPLDERPAKQQANGSAESEPEAEQDYMDIGKGPSRDKPSKRSTPTAEDMNLYESLCELSSAERQQRFDEDKGLKTLFRSCKKHKKALQKQGGASKNADEMEVEETEAFDYSTAPSVLQAGTETAERGKKKDKDKKKQKNFDPYAKALDTSKGAPKSKHGSGGGRSKTFKK